MVEDAAADLHQRSRKLRQMMGRRPVRSADEASKAAEDEALKAFDAEFVVHVSSGWFCFQWNARGCSSRGYKSRRSGSSDCRRCWSALLLDFVHLDLPRPPTWGVVAQLTSSFSLREGLSKPSR